MRYNPSMRLALAAPLVAVLALVSRSDGESTPPLGQTPDVEATIEAVVAATLEAAPSTSTPGTTPDIEATIEARVRATLEAIPTATPASTLAPVTSTPTPAPATKAPPAPSEASVDVEATIAAAVQATITARFRISFTPEPGGFWEPVVDPQPGPDGKYPAGTEVSIRAFLRLAHSRFVGWEGDASGTDPTTTVVVDRDLHIHAAFLHIGTATALPPLPTPTPEPTPTPTSTPGPPAQPDVRIDCILFDGAVPRSESDEYVQITNHGEGAQDLRGWSLSDASDNRREFLFHGSHVLGPRETIRVYTNELHDEWGGFSFGVGTAIWSNQAADTAVLLDADGRVASEATYDVTSPPGCLE